MVICIVGCLLFVYISLLISTVEPSLEKDAFYAVSTSDSFCVIKGSYNNLSTYLEPLRKNIIQKYANSSIIRICLIFSINYVLLHFIDIYVDECDELQRNDKIQVRQTYNVQIKNCMEKSCTLSFKKAIHCFISWHLEALIFCLNIWRSEDSLSMDYRLSEYLF